MRFRPRRLLFLLPPACSAVPVLKNPPLSSSHLSSTPIRRSQIEHFILVVVDITPYQPMMESHIGPSMGAVRGSSSASSSAELIVQSSPQRPRVAIPRLPQLSGDDGSGSPAGCGDKHRVSHACEPCRQRKTKVRATARVFSLVILRG